MLAESISNVCRSANTNGCVRDQVVVSRKALEKLEAITASAVYFEQAADNFTRAVRQEEDLLGANVRVVDQRIVALAAELARKALSTARALPMRGLPFVPVYLDAVEQINPSGKRVAALLDSVSGLLEKHMPHASIVEAKLGFIREDRVRPLEPNDHFPTLHAGVVTFVTRHGRDGYVAHLQAIQDLDGGGLPSHDFEAFSIRTWGGFAEAHEIARVLGYILGSQG